MDAVTKTQKAKIKILRKEPSPTRDTAATNFAQNLTRYFKMRLLRKVKGLSPALLLQKKLQGSMTVEAALVLPLCLMFLLNLGYAVECIRLHNRLELALWDTCGKVSVFAADTNEEAAADVISAAFIRLGITEFAGTEYLNHSPLTKGASGLRLLESEFLKGDRLDIKLTYEVSPLTGLAGFARFRMANRYVVHLWNGYEIPDNPIEAGLVYVAETGAVYHDERNCSFLCVSVKGTEPESLDYLKTRNDLPFEACQRCCFGEMPEIIYVTEDGSSYHYAANCSSLKRTVAAVPADKIPSELRPCSRCVK